MGLTNAVATIPGIIGPYVAKAIAHKVGFFFFKLNRQTVSVPVIEVMA